MNSPVAPSLFSQSSLRPQSTANTTQPPRIGTSVLAAILAVALLGIVAPAASAVTATFTPEADSQISASEPTTNFGTSTRLRVDGSPLLRSYMRFDVQLPDRAVVESAVLQLYRTWGTTTNGVYLSEIADEDWGEYTITHQNAPAPGARVAEWQGSSSGGWKSIALPAAAVVAGSNSFSVDTPGTILQSFGSREGEHKPQLVIDYTVSVTDPPPPMGPDLALGKVTSASGDQGVGFEADKAVDGNSATRWSSPAADDAWWQVDLGRSYSVERVDLNWDSAYASHYRILTSTDGSSFTEVADVSITSAGRTSSVFAARPARYVRVEGITRATSSAGISFWDAEVFGAGEEPPPPACSDEADNDGDGKVDDPDDPGCTGPTDDDETDPAPPATDPVIAAAGDIATASMRSKDTAALLGDVERVLAVGDLAYPDGTLNQFNTYYEPTWGKYKSKTYPVMGNHEYHTPGAAGYFDYFGSRAGPRAGWYSFDVGEWHVIALNSACAEEPDVFCSTGSEQERWLRQDLAANSSSCVLAYWHHPRWNEAAKGDEPAVAPLWNALYDNGADVVLAGHDHSYSRYAPRNEAGDVDLDHGIRQFTVGTGGAPLYDEPTPPETEVYNNRTPGVLKLTLHGGSYDWRFEPVAGKTFTDSGSEDCHDKPGSSTGGGPEAGMTLAWSDEFDGAAGSSPDRTSWAHQTGGLWGNGAELQCYTTRPENSSHDGGGNLQIVARREPYDCTKSSNDYTSARLTTKGKREFQYGYIEARIKPPAGAGIWPMFWTLGADRDVVGWPASGQIDIFELLGGDHDSINQTVHGPTSSGSRWRITDQTHGAAWDAGYHEYGLKWAEDRVTFYVDGAATRTIRPGDLQADWHWPFNKPNYLTLNVAVGGSRAGTPDATTPFPATMLVDYVRVYQ